jgi:hypothetical protein
MLRINPCGMTYPGKIHMHAYSTKVFVALNNTMYTGVVSYIGAGNNVHDVSALTG